MNNVGSKYESTKGETIEARRIGEKANGFVPEFRKN
jgi:hypothetical protein